MPLRPLGPRVATHGQPSRAVLGPWETTRGPERVEISRRPLSRVKRTTFARSELFRFAPTSVIGTHSRNETLWNIGSELLSLRLDVGRDNHLAPFFGLVGDELAEIGGRACEHGAA